MALTLKSPPPEVAPSRRMPESLRRQRLALEAEMDLGLLPGAGAANIGRWLRLAPQRLIAWALHATGLCPAGAAAFAELRLHDNIVQLAGLSADLEGMHLLQISDLHTDLNPMVIDAVISVIAGVDADATILAGDFRCRATCDTPLALQHLARLLPMLPTPVFAILGNHDTLAIADWLEEHGVFVLLNEAVDVCGPAGGTLRLAGIDDAHYFCTHDLTAALAQSAGDCPTILLSHTPAVWSDLESAKVDYVLCGHTHGGQICLPGGAPVRVHRGVPRSAVAGAWQLGGVAGYTCRGAGGSGIPIRINCPPQVTRHRLQH